MPLSGDKQPTRREFVILFSVFLISRLLLPLFGLHFQYRALFIYWQYLGTDTLRHHLLQGLWYDHAQPPLFNLILGIILQLFGDHAPMAFSGLLKLLSLVNITLLFLLLKRTIRHPWLPLALTLLYTLSPATLFFETELFYTFVISFLLLISALSLRFLQESIDTGRISHPWLLITGTLLPLVLCCFTRSMYHLLWLAGIGALLVFFLRKTAVWRKMLTGLILSLIVVSSWYVKNYVIFGQFSTSSWIGMNLARVVFHDPPHDSSRIEAIEPFSKLADYKPWLTGDSSAKARYAGLDDRDLIQETKNDSFPNLNAVPYISISKQYKEASTTQIRHHPLNYLTNVGQSAIMFFAPATRYPYAETQVKKIKYYDLLYSFNLSELAANRRQRQIALLLSALPALLVYLTVFFLLLREAFRNKKLPLFNLFAMTTIAFVFLAGSFLEHYENMRFRYEVQPLFLVLLGQTLRLLADPTYRQYLKLKTR